ncbi:hypothetical protein BD414DRAFT_515402 [Trametes punicea]|nr:hypothetical protein BD414DRAFT_515402 [Trametes punicea]
MLAAQPALHPYALPAAAAQSFMDKDPPACHLYLHQQRTVEVIQLIEVPPPPPRSHPYASSLASSSLVSSSCHSSDADADSDEDESLCSSYCSSDDDSDAPQAPVYDDTFKTRLDRVLAWREGFAKAFDDVESLPGSSPSHPVARLSPPSSPVSSSPTSSSRKRKAGSDVDFDFDDDTSSQSSKRSRSLPPEERIIWKERRLSAHACPACDAGFSSLQGLREHGMAAAVNDACREAVEYGFEP